MRGAALTLLSAAVTLAGSDSAPPASTWQILLKSTATPDEHFAAQELSGLLGNVTGSPVPIVALRFGPTPFTLAVGYDAATSVGLAASALKGLGNESWVVSSNASGLYAGCLAISGGKGASRGTIYGVYGLLKRWGFVFYSPTETVMPSATALKASAATPVDLTFSPAMEFRTMETFETNGGGDVHPPGLWALRSHNNDCLNQPAGGCMTYAEPPGEFTRNPAVACDVSDRLLVVIRAHKQPNISRHFLTECLRLQGVYTPATIC